MEFGKETAAIVFFAFAFLELALFGLSNLRAFYILPLALASAVTGLGIWFGYVWSSILMWATNIVTLVFGSIIAYASLSLGPASMIFGIAMIAFSAAVFAITVYVSLNWRKLIVAKRED
jgi:hypothetical protein